LDPIPKPPGFASDYIGAAEADFNKGAKGEPLTEAERAFVEKSLARGAQKAAIEKALRKIRSINTPAAPPLENFITATAPPLPSSFFPTRTQGLRTPNQGVNPVVELGRCFVHSFVTLLWTWISYLSEVFWKCNNNSLADYFVRLLYTERLTNFSTTPD
jgi:hypothetical protein